MNEIDFCCFTETRLNSDLIQMYNIEHCRGNFNCRNRKGGGVAVYTKKEYTVSVIDDLSLSQSFIESLFVKTKISSFIIIVEYYYLYSGLYMYKCFTAGHDWFTFYNNAAYTTRLPNQQALSYHNILTDHSRQSVRWIGARLWNGLPVELRTQDVPYETFKKRLKKHLIERQ